MSPHKLQLDRLESKLTKEMKPISYYMPSKELIMPSAMYKYSNLGVNTERSTVNASTVLAKTIMSSIMAKNTMGSIVKSAR